MLKDPKYSRETQIKWWALYHEVFVHIIKKGLESALLKYPEPIVKYFDKWNKENPDG